MEHVQSKLDEADVADINRRVTKKLRAALARFGYLFLCLKFCCCFVLAVAVDAALPAKEAALSLNGGDSTTLLCLLREKREETRSGFTLSQKLIANFQKFQIFATF